MHIKTLGILLVPALLLTFCCRNQPEITSSADHQNELRALSCSALVVGESEVFHVSAPHSGKMVFSFAGIHIRKGTILARIENADLVELQSAYLEACNMYDFFKEEYTRQGDLTVENATSIKKMQIARRDFQTAENRKNSLSLQLKILGLNPDSVSADNIISALFISSPISGTITHSYRQTGSIVEKGEDLFEITENQTLKLKILIPEEFYTRIDTGLKLTARSPYDSLSVIRGKITSLIPEIDPATRVAVAFAKIHEVQGVIIPGMSMNADISLIPDTLNNIPR